MYDISDGDSFLAVRQWLDCVQVSKGALTLNQLWNKYLKKKLYVLYLIIQSSENATASIFGLSGRISKPMPHELVYNFQTMNKLQNICISYDINIVKF